nr:hypothetical protein [Tanacetum cinerariifolium]
MAPLTLTDMHNMVAFLSKSNTSKGFDQIVDFLNAHTIQYALVVNHTIYVSCIKQFWATATIKQVNDAVQLRALIDGKKVVVFEAIIQRDLHLDNADGVECLPNEEIFEELARMGYEKAPLKMTFYKAFFSVQWKFLIYNLVQCLSSKRTAWNAFSCSMASVVICLATCRKCNFSMYIFDSMVRNVDSPSKFLMYPRFLQVVMDNQVDDMTSHNTRYTSPALAQKVFANIRGVGKGFSGVETPLFALMLVPPQPQADEEAEEVKVPIAPAPLPPALQDTTPTPHATPPQDQPSIPHASPPQEQPTATSKSSMSLLTTLMETCATLSQKRRINKKEVNATSKDVSATEPTVFDDEEVTMTMAQTLIKLKLWKGFSKIRVSLVKAWISDQDFGLDLGVGVGSCEGGEGSFVGDGGVGALGISTSSSSAACGYSGTSIEANKGVSTPEKTFPSLCILANSLCVRAGDVYLVL